MYAKEVVSALKSLASATKAAELQRFFKTGPGEYGEGDVFLGVMVPSTRKIASKFSDLSLTEISKLMKSDFHEARLCGLIILTNQYKKSKDLSQKKSYFEFYIKLLHSGYINNWDLVDVSAPTIGEYLLQINEPMPILIKLSGSKSLWERRASMILTFAFIRDGHLDPTYELAQTLLKDEHDLMHKAVGWMLREMGKRDVGLLRSFLSNHCAEMPRTTLRYAIEKMSESERKKWLLTK